MSSAASNMLTIGTVLVVLFVIRRRRWYQRKQNLIDHQSDYDSLLARYNPYYKSLSSEGRDRFLKRTLHFIEKKKFEFVDMEEQESIPLLIGATAIQLTFGLDHYLLGYFKTIYIIKDRYTYGPSPTPFEGVARPIFERMQAGETNLLNPYAATNYQEFWAVCVEAFFERSRNFKDQLPELYTALCTLLNQDPLTNLKILTH